MKKEDIIHLHGTLSRVRKALEEAGIEGAPDAYATYDSLGILAMHIHRPKRDHSFAVVALGDGIERTINAETKYALIKPKGRERL